ncbi:MULTISPECIES: hypothetical protein [unclassified Streptomyces]|uniref:hypothetical protein n=1 Tax=unclassified Streptomyces TaxID=2593676 RepID=UPI0036EC8F4A
MKTLPQTDTTPLIRADFSDEASRQALRTTRPERTASSTDSRPDRQYRESAAESGAPVRVLTRKPV